MVYAALLQSLAIGIVALDNHVFKSSGGTFTEYSGGQVARDIAIDRTGKPWIISQVDNTILYHDGQAWVSMPTITAVRIAVDKCGNPVIMGTNQKVYKWNGYSWFEVPGSGTIADLAVDGNGRVWVVNPRLAVYSNLVGVWEFYVGNGSAKTIAASADGTPYIISINDRAMKGNGTGFTDLGISGKDIAVSSFGTVWVIDSNNDPYFLKNGHWYKHPDAKKGVAISAA